MVWENEKWVMEHELLEALDEYGLDVFEFRIYLHIFRKGEGSWLSQSIAEISQDCHISQAVVGQAIRVLCHSHLIETSMSNGVKPSYCANSFEQWVDPELLPQIRKLPKLASSIPGYVYLALAEGTNRYKIGVSENPSNRIKQLNEQLAFKITQIHQIAAKDMVESERWLHQLFANRRIHGEWFELDQKAVDYICSLEGQS